MSDRPSFEALPREALQDEATFLDAIHL